MSTEDHDVVVATYGDRDAASAALAMLVQSAAEGTLEIADAAIVGRAADGSVKVDHEQPGVKRGAGAGAIVGAAIGLIFPPALLGTALIGAGLGAGTAKLAKDDHTERKLDDLARSFAPGTAGLVVAVDPGWTAAVVEALGENVTLTQRVLQDSGPES